MTRPAGDRRGGSTIDTFAPPVATGTPPMGTGVPRVDTFASPVGTGASPVGTGASPVDTFAPHVATGTPHVEARRGSFEGRVGWQRRGRGFFRTRVVMPFFAVVMPFFGDRFAKKSLRWCAREIKSQSHLADARGVRAGMSAACGGRWDFRRGTGMGARSCLKSLPKGLARCRDAREGDVRSRCLRMQTLLLLVRAGHRSELFLAIDGICSAGIPRGQCETGE